MAQERDIQRKASIPAKKRRREAEQECLEEQVEAKKSKGRATSSGKSKGSKVKESKKSLASVDFSSNYSCGFCSLPLFWWPFYSCGKNSPR